MSAIPRPRRSSALVLMVVAAIQLLPLLPAIGLADCFCDETMCVHRHRHAGGEHAEHAAKASQPATGAAHCDRAAAKTAPDCTMRGCSHDGDHALPSLGLGALTPVVSMAAPVVVSSLDAVETPPLLDRFPSIETPPPDASRV